MFESLTNALRTFSFRSILKSNIIGSTLNLGTANSVQIDGVRNNTLSSLTSNRLLSTYYIRMQEIKDYEVTDLSNVAVQIFIDYIVNYINTESDLITLSDKVAKKDTLERKVNKVFTDLDVANETKDHLWDIIYNGRYCFKVHWDSEHKVFTKDSLIHPHSVITVKSNNKVKSHLVVSRDRKIIEVKPDSIFTIGGSNLNLQNDMNEEFFNSHIDEDTLVKDYDLYAGMPLYYNICGKVKEYLLKEQILTLLSIKDLIQPLLLLLNVDRSTPPDEANKAALNTENLINKYSDISSILGSNFSINDLIDSLLNNIRVLPDYSSAVGNMGSVDLSKITNKIQEIRGDQDGSKENIFQSLSIPRSLYSGDSTKWDAIKGSQRLSSRVNNLITDIVNSIRYQAQVYIYRTSGVMIPMQYITCNLFGKTDVDYSTSINNSDIISQLADNITRIMDTTQRTMSDSKIVDKQAFGRYMIKKIAAIDSEAKNFINEKSIDNYVKELDSENQSSGEGGEY